MNKIKFDGKVFIHIRRGRISEKERIANKVDSIIEQSKYAVTMLNYPKPKKADVVVVVVVVNCRIFNIVIKVFKNYAVIFIVNKIKEY